MEKVDQRMEDEKNRENTEQPETVEVAEEQVEFAPISEESLDGSSIPEELAILPLRGVVVYPVTFQALSVGQPRSIHLVDDAMVNK